MNGTQVRAARKARGLTQVQLARQLGVSQGYVSLVESNQRSVPTNVAQRLAAVLPMSATSVPVTDTSPLNAEQAPRLLGSLGYRGFGYLESKRRMNPAEVLLRTLRSETLDGRVARALPWLVVEYPDLNWNWLVRQAKQQDLQNRLGFVVSLGRALAEAKGRAHASALLAKWERRLEASRLLKKDRLSAMTQAEERWLLEHSSPEARHWNVLSSLTADSVSHGS